MCTYVQQTVLGKGCYTVILAESEILVPVCKCFIRPCGLVILRKYLHGNSRQHVHCIGSFLLTDKVKTFALTVISNITIKPTTV